jgi:urate oxidase
MAGGASQQDDDGAGGIGGAGADARTADSRGAAVGEDAGGIVLGPTRYGKAEIRLVHIGRDTPRHRIRDLTLSTALTGRFADSHVTGDQTGQLPTDSQKNTVYAYARQHGVGPIEDFGLRLARHFVDDIDLATGAQIHLAEQAWDRIEVDGAGHDHSFVRGGAGVRTATVTVQGTGAEQRAWVIAGVQDLVVLKSTGSEYRGYLKDPYTTLAETDDRVLATSLLARWRYSGTDHIDWDATHRQVCATLLATFATEHSRALQHSLWLMGRAVLADHPEIAEIRLSAPNKHHFLVDLQPFGLDNPGEVFYAADRPYGLIEATVQRDGAPDGGPAWQGGLAG